MFIPKKFNIAETDEAFAFIQANSFGQLISNVDGRLFSTHIPFLLAGDRKRLICHVAKKNPQWQHIDTQEVLITFQGPHDYISPSWYSSAGVPTWNYQAVHIYGKPTLVTEPDKLKDIVNELTGVYESSFDKPWEPTYNEAMLNLIVGIEIEITDIQCQYKLSQNRSDTDQKQVIEQLQKRGSQQLSQVMKDK